MDSAGERFEAIRAALADRNNILTVKDLCELAGVSRSGYYNWVRSEKKRELREAKDRAAFEQILEAYRFRGLRKGRSRHSYAAFAHGYPNEREEDPPPDAEIQAHLPHPKAESLPQIAAIHPNGQRRGEFGQPGIRVSWAESHPPDGHHIHPALRQILLPLHDPGRLHKAGPGLCDERIAGSGFCFGNGPAAGKAPWDLAEQGDRDPQRPGGPTTPV